jgi:hypothetical protein
VNVGATPPWKLQDLEDSTSTNRMKNHEKQSALDAAMLGWIYDYATLIVVHDKMPDGVCESLGMHGNAGAVVIYMYTRLHLLSRQDHTVAAG